ncbi:MAG: FAD:protein FMN transferase [Cyclobacteriaceae bacterium]
MSKSILLALFVTVIMGCSSDSQDAEIKRYEFEHPSMGSLFRVVVYANDSARVSTLVEASFQELDSLNMIMSDYIPTSELMRLSRSSGTGKYVSVSEDLMEILKMSEYWYSWSAGLFDVTIGPITQLWRRAKRQGQLPKKQHFDGAMSSVGFKYLKIDDEKGVLLEKTNMQLDLGGIAKGYAVDMIFESLRKNEYTQCLVDGAGDLRVGEAPPGKDGWEIAINTYVGKDSTMFISNQAVATSGDFYRNLQIDGKSYSHIIDPSTGYGITVSRAVTVFANDCTTADVLASVFSVAGPYQSDLNGKIPNSGQVMIFEKAGEETEIFSISTKKPQSDF